MVEIKNISVKPICIGGVSLLPGKSNTVEDAFMDAVNFYVCLLYTSPSPRDTR